MERLVTDENGYRRKRSWRQNLWEHPMFKGKREEREMGERDSVLWGNFAICGHTTSVHQGAEPPYSGECDKALRRV